MKISNCFIFLVIFLIILLVGCLRYNPKDDTDDPNSSTRSGLKIYTDHKTGLQYIGSGYFGGITPRLDKDGKHMRAPKNDESK